jgi:hypothetical protein
MAGVNNPTEGVYIRCFTAYQDGVLGALPGVHPRCASDYPGFEIFCKLLIYIGKYCSMRCYSAAPRKEVPVADFVKGARGGRGF